MATEKILNTRIINKHALLSEWDSSELILKDGEIALAKVTLTEQHTDGKISEVPAYIVKVGTGDKKFKETAWAYAKAADVHAWAKQQNLPVRVIGDGNAITNVEFGTWVEDGATKYGITATKGETFVTSDELDTIIAGYVKSVSGKDAIKSTGGQNPEISLALDNSGNVQFTQSDAGLKGNIDLSNFATKAEIPEIPTNHKILQTPVVDPTANGSALAFIDTISQNANGEITATKKNVDLSNYKTKQAVVDETGATNKTVTKVTQDENGVVDVTFGDIEITESQIKDLHKVEVASGDYINVVSTTSTDATTGAVTTTYTVSAIESSLKALIAADTTAAMEFKGATATLPENPAKGDMYKVAGENISIKINNVDAKTGDSIVYNGEQWFLIPSGDDIEDTWRVIQVEGSPIKSSNTINFIGGDHINVVADVDSSNEDVTNVTISLDHDYIYGHSISEGEGGAIGFDLYRQGDCTSSNTDERIVGMVISAGDEMEVESTETFEGLVMGTISHKEIDCTVTPSSSTLDHKDTFDVVKNITVNEYGHVTGLETETYTLPTQYEHPNAANSESSNATTLAHGDSFDVVTESFDTQGHRIGTHTETYTLPELPETIGTAVQEITSNCTAGQETSGLKVTRTENSVNVEIDDSVTFIFDCGGAE